MSPYSEVISDPNGLHLNELESPGPKDVPCQISIHSDQWFTRRRFF